MLLKNELKRAFGWTFIFALFLGVLSGIGGIIAYYLDCQWHEPSAISCYEAWLFCLSVSEPSLYRVVFPLIICLPFLSTFYTDRMETSNCKISSKSTYINFWGTKTIVGLVSAMAVILLTLIIWFFICFMLFPDNPPTTIVNYTPKGAFAHFYPSQPIIYIGCVIMLNLITAVTYYLFSISLSYFVNNKWIAVLGSFVLHFSLIMISQVNHLSFLDPVLLITPLEIPSSSFFQILLRWALILIFSCVVQYRFYKKDYKTRLAKV